MTEFDGCHPPAPCALDAGVDGGEGTGRLHALIPWPPGRSVPRESGGAGIRRRMRICRYIIGKFNAPEPRMGAPVPGSDRYRLEFHAGGDAPCTRRSIADKSREPADRITIVYVATIGQVTAVDRQRVAVARVRIGYGA